ncbi:MAG TPA: PilN domain-containing protein [Arenimonas sp.]|uniref:PilN domain-containing protein n=1 Tax=Arenimonas sp. TaxID=1872635 RepID=UPI002D7E6A78|nr:PilN domain-containing protein [Arenimonas sp.]HEU0151903.1 PilN domain-containing protein [Arenimonas sp.]
MPAADRLATLLDPLKLRLARSTLPARLREAVLSLLPARWRDQVAGETQRLCLWRHDDTLVLVAARHRGDLRLGEVPLDPDLLEALGARADASGTPRWLMVPAASMLRRVLVLPAAAEPRLREVLAFELDRQTPFSADQVSFEGCVLSRDVAAQQLRVELLVLPRTRLDAELAAIGPLARGLAGVDGIEADGRRLGLNLLPDAARAQRRDPVRRLHLALAATAVVGLLATLGLSLHNRAERRDELRALVASANDQAREARLLRNQLVSSAQAANFLAATRASRPTMLEVMDELTRRIPDDTSLDKLAITGDQLVMVGQSRAAPALVALLQASPLITDPALSGVVQSDPRTGRDRFTLTARVVNAATEGVDDEGR